MHVRGKFLVKLILKLDQKININEKIEKSGPVSDGTVLDIIGLDFQSNEN